MSTPLMKQYYEVKSRYPDTILLFRLGDFYETFEQDAVTTSKTLGITLTKRNNGVAGEIPLAGFPYHALDNYLPKFLKAGLKIAICDQLEDPKFAKGIVKRDVTEVVTPGVAILDKALSRNQNNYLMGIYFPHALVTKNDFIGCAYADISTGEFITSRIEFSFLKQFINSIEPSEILIQKRDKETLIELLKNKNAPLITSIEDWVCKTEYARDTLLGHFKIQSLKGFGIENENESIIASGIVMHYFKETQKANLKQIQKITPANFTETISLDSSTKRNLEIISSIAGDGEGTLFSVLNRTQTAMGARLFKKWISAPLKSIDKINYRLKSVKTFFNNSKLRSSLHSELSSINDIERLLAKIITNRGTPREVLALKYFLIQLPQIKEIFKESNQESLKNLNEKIFLFNNLADEISKSINEDAPTNFSTGGVIKKGCNRELDELTEIASSAKSWVAKMQLHEKERTGISSLKIGFNNIFGYYIEITNTHKNKIPAEYIRKQTMTNAERYITPELKEYEEKILTAEEKILKLESEIFNELREKIILETGRIQIVCEAIAELDCFISLATIAIEKKYVEPEISEKQILNIVDGRHPVIEALLPSTETYTPNSVSLDINSNQILIITGPNMSGKSSFLRQTGLIVLLAQVGSFVPAKKAVVGIVDNIFTRVGASDNISSGESTFLVEMIEAANIVNRATNRSLILLDEVGRGTSTFDGISIAWALTEFIHDKIGARTLFATHYHELNEIANIFPRIKNFKVDVKEYGDKVIFLHTVTSGTADHSYGIHVAKMAGLPNTITERAKIILNNLESTQLTPHTEMPIDPKKIKKVRKYIDAVNNTTQITMLQIEDDELRKKLQEVDLNQMTPLEALQFLAKLKENL
ncbi:MAG: DNA mismatch repair protein MutS [Bacteroidota bacterium]